MAVFSTEDGWIAYRVVGEGFPVLVLHGALGTARAHFGRAAERLAERYTVIMPDLPGHGSSSPRSFFEEDYYRQDGLIFGRLVESLDIGPVHLIGFSDGAMMALSLAADRQDLVRSLVAIGGQAYIDEPTVAGLRSWADPDSLPPTWRQSFARLHGEPYWRELTRAYVEGQERILASGGEVVRQRLSLINSPTLIMHGRDDAVIDVIHADVVASNISGAALVVHEDCGHFVLRDQEQVAVDAIIGFIEKQDTPS